MSASRAWLYGVTGDFVLSEDPGEEVTVVVMVVGEVMIREVVVEEEAASGRSLITSFS